MPFRLGPILFSPVVKSWHSKQRFSAAAWPTDGHSVSKAATNSADVKSRCMVRYFDARVGEVNLFKALGLVASSAAAWQILRMSAACTVLLHDHRCLNHAADDATPICTRCRDACPAQAIGLDGQGPPRIQASTCTDCGACIAACPVAAIKHPGFDERDILNLANRRKRQGIAMLTAACAAANAEDADAVVPCHAVWDPCLLACLAAAGMRTLNLSGLEQCRTCTHLYGAQVFEQTRKEYKRLNASLDVHMEIRSTPAKKRGEPRAQPATESVPSPSRRAFFHNLLPAVMQGAVQVTRPEARAAAGAAVAAANSRLPLRLRLFLRALPHLHPNFTPLPRLPSLPLGSIQADARCTACHRCVEHCPTAALALKPFGDDWLLELQPQACIGCRRCEAVCPEEAIEALPTLSLPALLAAKPRPLVLIPKAKADKAAAGFHGGG